MATRALTRALQLRERLKSKVSRELGMSHGGPMMEEVKRRDIRRLTRDAAMGHTDSMVEIMDLASQQPDHGVNEPCPLCSEIEEVMRGY